MRELRIWAALSHPNILQLTGFFLDENDLKQGIIISPYMRHGNIVEYLQKVDEPREKRLGLVGFGIPYATSCYLLLFAIQGA